MSFPRYPSYKDSGVEWLGEVPEHWEVKRLRFAAKVRKGRLPKVTFPAPTADTDLPYLSMEYLRGESEAPSYVSASPDLLCAEAGDLLLLWDGSNAGEFLRAKAGVVSSTVALIEPRNIEKEFLFFACKARERELKDQTVGMGIPHVSGDDLRSFSIPCPDPAEQTAIAEFLDGETGKIDELVAEQRRLVELLKEKRQAVISHAVTRGLNPAAPLKPSGIEWIGNVPAHWSVIPLKRVCRIESGHTPQKSNEAYWVPEDCCIPWISLNDTKVLAASDFIDETEVSITALGMHNSSAHLIEAGAVVMNRDGARVGLSAITTKPMCVSQHIIAWVCGASVFNHYLLHVLYAMNDEIYRLAGGATIPTIGMPDIREMTMPLPPLSEQIAIVDYLLEQRHRLDTLTAEAQRAIDLLQERRTALISAAVTGQIDVRPLAAKKAA